MRRGAVEAAALHGAAHHEVMPAPAVIRAVGIRAQRAAEIRGRERGDLVGHAQVHRGCIERAHRLVEPLHAAAGGPASAGCDCRSRPATRRTPGAHVERGARADEPRDDLQLVGERIARAEHVVGRRRQRHTRQRAVHHALASRSSAASPMAYSFSSTCVLLRVISEFNAVRSAAQLVCAGSMPRILIAPPVLIWYCSASRPGDEHRVAAKPKYR